jgi:hypothetical protein
MATAPARPSAPRSPPRFTLTVTEDADLDLNLTLYYCETEDQRLCMIHNAQMTLPLKMHQGSRSEVQIEVQVLAEQHFG